MSKQINKFFIKVFMLSTFLVLIFNVGGNFINANSNEVKAKSTNIETYKKSSSNSLGIVGVALSTNIGIKYSQREKLGNTIYKDIFSVSDLMNKKGDSDELLSKNMILVQEYQNVLRTNVRELINTNYDKSKILDAFIEQLEFRYINAAENVKTLIIQKEELLAEMENINVEISKLKTKIESDFKKFDSEESLKNIDKYTELKKNYYFSRTYVIYITKFINQYNYLSSFNKKLLDTLILNKEALIKDVSIKLPDTGTELLKEFDLIISEEDYKNKKR